MVRAMFPLHKGQRLMEAIHPFWASLDTSRWPGGLSPQWGRRVLCFMLSQAFGPASLQPLIPKLEKGARQRRLCSKCAEKSRGRSQPSGTLPVLTCCENASGNIHKHHL